MQYSDIADDLRGKILRQAIIAGQPLPDVATLTARYVVSDSTARRAERVLLAEGLATRVHAEGLLVAEAEPVLVLHRVLNDINAGDQPDLHDVRKLVAMVLGLWQKRRQPFRLSEAQSHASS